MSAAGSADILQARNKEEIMDYSKYAEIAKKAKKEVSADDLVDALARATSRALGNDLLISCKQILFAREITYGVMRILFPELEEQFKAVEGRDAEDE